MHRTSLILPVVAGLLLAGLPVRAEISGFQLNKIEGVGDLEGKLNGRLVDDQQVSYADCLVYLAGAVAVQDGGECSTDAECTADLARPVCAVVDGKAACVECLTSADCVGGDKPFCDVGTHACSAPPVAGECAWDFDCKKDPAKPACGLAHADGGKQWTCMACTDDMHCLEGMVCSTVGGAPACVADEEPAECVACSDPTPACALLSGTWTCVECVVTGDCTQTRPGTVCDLGTRKCIAAPADDGCAVTPTLCTKDKPLCAVVGSQWTCVACVTQSDCGSSGPMFTCDQATHVCVDACLMCAGSCLPVGGEWTCVGCVDSTDCDAPQTCDPATHLCVIPPVVGDCVSTSDCQGSGNCLLYYGAWTCLECSDDRDCTADATKPACATAGGSLKCVQCASDSDCTEGTCDTATHTCGAGSTSTPGTKPKILIRWSLSPSSGYDYAIRGGSCSDTGGIGDAPTDSCFDVVTKQPLPGSTNNEFTLDLRKLIGDTCTSGDTGEASLYFFIQYGDDATTKEVEVVKFEWDYEPPDQPQNLQVSAGEGNLKVTWEDDSGSGADHYKVYWSDEQFDGDTLDKASSKGSITAKTYQISGLEVGTTYFVGVTAVDEVGNESELPELLNGTPISVDDFWEHYQKSGGQEEGGFCFVATAAWGSPLQPSVALLRTFRDRALLTSPWGRSLVGMYYTWGPPAARYIKDRPVLRFAARVALLPAVGVAWLTVRASGLERLGITLALAAAAAWWWRRRRAAVRPGRVA